MKLFPALIAGVFALVTFSAVAADSGCEAKAIDKNGKPLAGAAKAASIKKCEKDAAAVTAPSCEEKAVSKAGKPLAGAAKAAFIKKCEADTKK
ncbi:MAG: hypothetical protein WA632_05715 [Gallionella sp.]